MTRSWSLRLRLTLVSLAIAAVAVAIAIALLLFVLERSLLDELDESLAQQVSDAAEETELFGSEGIFLSGDPRVVSAVFDQAGNALVSPLFEEIDPADILASLVGTSAEGGTPVDEPIEIALPLEGFERSRALTTTFSVEGVADFVDDDGEVFEGVEGEQGFVFVARSRASVDETVRRVTIAALPIGIGLALSVGLLTWLLTGRSLRPVERIRREVDAIGSTSELARRVPLTGRGDEIDDLAHTMNEMLGRLEAGQEQQSRFVSDAAHELRSPVASMIAQLDVELAHPDPALWEETAGHLRDDAGRLERLIDDLLALARSEASADRTAAVRVPFGELVVDVAGSVHVDGVHVDTSGVGPAEVSGSADQLRRIVVNLVTNAQRHASTTVDIGLVSTNGVARLTIDDDGDGVAVDDRQRIFDRFVRLDASRSRDAGGSGLGLALVRELVVAHGGRVGVTDAPRGGARFVVELPVES